MLSTIAVYPPVPPDEPLVEGDIRKRDSYVATANPPWGPFGYGNTAQEAVDDVRQQLHQVVDSLPAFLTKERGLFDRHLEESHEPPNNAS